MSAGRLGIEPRLKASKASVLPLDDLPRLKQYKNTSKMVIFQVSDIIKVIDKRQENYHLN